MKQIAPAVLGVLLMGMLYGTGIWIQRGGLDEAKTGKAIVSASVQSDETPTAAAKPTPALIETTLRAEEIQPTATEELDSVSFASAKPRLTPRVKRVLALQREHEAAWSTKNYFAAHESLQQLACAFEQLTREELAVKGLKPFTLGPQDSESLTLEPGWAEWQRIGRASYITSLEKRDMIFCGR